MEMVRRILDKEEMTEWFKKFGNDKLSFEKIFGSENEDKLLPGDRYYFKVVDGIMFVKMTVRSYDVFGSTTQYVDLDRYIVVPQMNMYV